MKLEELTEQLAEAEIIPRNPLAVKLEERIAKFEQAAELQMQYSLMNTGAANALKELLSEIEAGEQPASQEEE